MLDIAPVTSKGQVTLPASVRRRLGLRKGDRIAFLEAGDEVRVIREEDLERRFEVFERRRKELGLTPAKLSAFVKEAKHRLWKEHGHPMETRTIPAPGSRRGNRAIGLEGPTASGPAVHDAPLPATASSSQATNPYIDSKDSTFPSAWIGKTYRAS